MKKTLSILLFSMLLFTTCKKYPEGGFLRQGPKVFTTIKNGMWKLALYEVNCIDSTNLINTPIITNGTNFYTDFLGCAGINDKNYKNTYEADTHSYSYIVKFANNNKLISFEALSIYSSQCQTTTNGISCERNILNPEGIGLVTFTILKLRDKECILTTTLKNNYKIILKR